MAEKKNGVEIHFRGFPEDLHKEIKLDAVRAEVTMKDWVIEACREKLERGKNERMECGS